MPHTAAFEMGDTVRLACGGPLMTVLSVDGQECCCMWFGDGGRFEHGSFEVAAVELLDRPPRLIPTPERAGRWRDRRLREPRSGQPTGA